MAKERTGKLEKWILIHAYKKTVLHELPENWQYPRLYKYSQDDDKEFYNNHFLKVDLLNYFDLSLSFRLPKEDYYLKWRPKPLEEKFENTKEYRSALVSCSRTIEKMDKEEKGLIETDCSSEYENTTMRQTTYDLKKGGWGANTRQTWGYKLTSEGIKQVKVFLNVNK